jgi:hypothetical protein
MKEILLKQTPSQCYDPSEFIEGILEIIKKVFVMEESKINELLKLDNANKLQLMLTDIAKEYDLDYGLYQEETA